MPTRRIQNVDELIDAMNRLADSVDATKHAVLGLSAFIAEMPGADQVDMTAVRSHIQKAIEKDRHPGLRQAQLPQAMGFAQEIRDAAIQRAKQQSQG